LEIGRAIAESVSHRVHYAGTGFRAQHRTCGIFGSRSGTGIGFSPSISCVQFICVLFPGIELCHIFIEFICSVYVVVLSCILVMGHGHVAYLDLSVLFPGPTSLLSTYKGCVFFLAVFMCVVIQETNVISLEQTLMVTIRIQTFVVSFGLPNGTFWRILKGVALKRLVISGHSEQKMIAFGIFALCKISIISYNISCSRS